MKKYFLILTLLTLCIFNIQAQLRFQPNFGMLFLQNKLLEKSPNARPLQNIPSPYLGFSVNYKKYKNQLELGINLAGVGSGISYDSKIEAPYSKGIISYNLQMSLCYHRKIKAYSFFPKYIERKTRLPYTISKPKQKFYYLNFDLYPFIGVGLNKFYPSKWYSKNVTNDYQTFYHDEGYNIRLLTKDYLLHKYVPSILIGFKFQFRSNKQDLLALSLIYNLGLQNQIKNQWEYKGPNETNFNTVVHTVSKGTYFGFILSFPIEIAHKNRYIHPQNIKYKK